MILAGFVAFVTALLWVMQVVFLDDFYKYIKINEIREAASVIRGSMEEDDLEEKIDYICQTGNMAVMLVETNGTVVYNKGNFIAAKYTNVYIQMNTLLEKLENENEYIVITPAETPEEPRRPLQPRVQERLPENIMLATIATYSGDKEIVVIIYSNITPVDSTIQTIRFQLIIITVILLAVVLLIALMVSILISRPIMKITETSKELARGNYNIVFKAGGYREISELSQTLNHVTGELLRVDDYRRELMANVSHDLRTPLTLISGYSEAMRDIPGENTSENIQTIIDESNRLTTLVNDVLDLSRLEANEQQLNISCYNITQNIRQIVTRVGKMTTSEGYEVVFLSSEDVYVRADEMKISQVLYNLLGNAITHTGEDKRVIIEQTLLKNVVRVSVTDSGDGIPKEKMKQIWERYYKVDKEHKRARVGTGLGLSIVKSIFNLHKNKYGVISEIGKGSTFWFELPLV